MYNAPPATLPQHVTVLGTVGPNPDRADEYTEADRRGAEEQQAIEVNPLQAAERAVYQHRLEQIRAKRSTSNIHAGGSTTVDYSYPAPQQSVEAVQQPPAVIQLATLSSSSSPVNASPTATGPASVVSASARPPSSSPSTPRSAATAGEAGTTDDGAAHPKLGTAGVKGASRGSSLHLDRLDDEQIRALLDPAREDVAWKDMASWDEDKLDALVAATRPQNLPELLRQSMAVNELQPAKLLEWRDLSYVNKLGQPLLKNVTGYLAPGQMVGVFAGPDAGGTPLLNVLGQRKVTGLINGTITYDHRAPDETFNKTVGYVMKDDPHLPTLTVYETLYFSARCRLPSATPDKLVRFRTLLFLKFLGLSHVMHNIVGNAMIRGISGGERRRLSFGVEMVVGHSVLLADLPTNGLDSATAFAVMRTMRFATLASTSMLCTIVQPSPELYALFHRVLVLSKGAAVYFGPHDLAEEHLAQLGFNRPGEKTIPQFLEEMSAAPERFYQARLSQQQQPQQQRRAQSPQANGTELSAWESEQLGESHIKRLGVLRPAPTSSPESEANVSGAAQQKANARVDAWNALVDGYEASEFRELLDAQMKEEDTKAKQQEERLRERKSKQPHDAVLLERDHGVMRWWYRRYNSSPWQQLQQNFQRQYLLFYRDKGLWRDAWLVNIVLGFFLGSLFYDQGDDQQSIRNRIGLLFYMAAYIGFGGLSLAPVVLMQRSAYYSQQNAMYYHGLAYFTAFVTLLIPVVVFKVFFLLLPAYGLAHLTGPDFAGAQFGYAFLMLIACALTSQSFVLIVLALSANAALANVMLVQSNILFFLLAGFLLQTAEIEASYYWLHIIDYFSYVFRGLTVNDIQDRYYNCGTAPSFNCPYNKGYDALGKYYDIQSGSNKWIDFARVVGCFFAFTIAAGVAYLYLNWDIPDEPEGPNWGGNPGELAAPKSDKEQAQQQSAAAEQKDGGEQASGRDSGVGGAQVAGAGGGQTGAGGGGSYADQQTSNGNGNGAHAVVDMHDNPTSSAHPPIERNRSRSGSRNRSMDALNLPKSYIQWKDLCYDVRLPDGSTRRLLNKCYGYAQPGTMCALMGASGAGKSTLLDVLAGFKNQGVISGELLVNGRPRDASFTSIVGYVEQFDSHNALSTIFEAVHFSGRLRLPRTVTDADLDKKVWSVLRLLEIDHLAQAIIGAAGYGGVAPEIRKKVTIAVELIMQPRILFLDEPTTGLDSAGAYAVIKTVAKLSERMAVVCTIHQPPIEIVHFFEQIILMKAGGEVVYFGPMSDLTSYFQEVGMGEIQGADKNPVDFALEQLKQANELATNQKDPGDIDAGEDDDDAAGDKAAASTPEADEQKQAAQQRTAPPKPQRQLSSQAAVAITPEQAKRLPQTFLESEYSKEVRQTLSEGVCPPEQRSDDARAAAEERELVSSRPWFTTQVAVLTRRNFLNIYRNRFDLKVRYGTVILYSFFVGTIFLRLGYNQAWASERLSVIFVTVAYALYAAAAYLPEIFMVRTIYFRETSARMYSPISFFIARYAGDALFLIVEMFIMALMIYFMTHLSSRNHSANFGYFFWTLLLTRWLSIGMTHTISSVFASPGFAATILIAYMNTLFAACGFFIPKPSIHHDWLWYYYIVPLRYSLDFLVQREYGYADDMFYCSPDEMVQYAEPGVPYTGPCAYASQGNIVTRPNGEVWKCPYACGYEFLESFGVSWSAINQVENLIILHCFMAFFFLTAFLALRFINHIKR